LIHHLTAGSSSEEVSESFHSSSDSISFDSGISTSFFYHMTLIYVYFLCHFEVSSDEIPPFM